MSRKKHKRKPTEESLGPRATESPEQARLEEEPAEETEEMQQDHPLIAEPDESEDLKEEGADIGYPQETESKQAEESMSKQSQGKKPEAALTTETWDQATWVQPRAQPSQLEYVPPQRYRGDNSPLGKRVRAVQHKEQAPTGLCAVTVSPTVVYDVDLDRGRGMVPQAVADTITREGGPLRLM